MNNNVIEHTIDKKKPEPWAIGSSYWYFVLLLFYP